MSTYEAKNASKYTTPLKTGAFHSDDSEEDSTPKAQALQKAGLKLGQKERKLKARLGYSKTLSQINKLYL